MALELRPNCELCDADLPPSSEAARICSYECTFCANCVDTVLQNVCPNCGGGLVARPIRPVGEWRPGVSLDLHPAGTTRHAAKYNADDIAAHAVRIASIPPAER